MLGTQKLWMTSREVPWMRTGAPTGTWISFAVVTMFEETSSGVTDLPPPLVADRPRWSADSAPSPIRPRARLVRKELDHHDEDKDNSGNHGSGDRAGGKLVRLPAWSGQGRAWPSSVWRLRATAMTSTAMTSR